MIEHVDGYGLLAIDKAGGRILFLDPATLAIRKAVSDVPAKPHELLLLTHLGKAYVPIFGDGIHGDNPHPGHQIAVVDLQHEQVITLISLSPYEAPHTARLAENGLVYCCCETSGVVAVIDPVRDEMIDVVNVGSRNVHRLTTVPGCPHLVTESEEDATLCMIDTSKGNGEAIRQEKMPGPLNGVAAAPTRPWIVCTHGAAPELFVVDCDSLSLLRTVALRGHAKQGQIVRYRADGEVLAVIGDFEPVASFYDADLNHLFTAEIGDKPLDGAFTPDGRMFLVANEKSGTVSIVDLEARRTRGDAAVPVGTEVLEYFPLR